jgi:hypothetical protein
MSSASSIMQTFTCRCAQHKSWLLKAAVNTTAQVKAIVKSIATTVEAGPEVSATTAATASAQQQQQ